MPGNLQSLFKMVHGGLRYIAQGDIGLTQDSLGSGAPAARTSRPDPAHGLLLYPAQGPVPGRLPFSILLTIYDRLAGIKRPSLLPGGKLNSASPVSIARD